MKWTPYGTKQKRLNAVDFIGGLKVPHDLPIDSEV